MKIYILVLAFLVGACGNVPLENASPNIPGRPTGKIFVSSGTSSYLLPQLPNWANFSRLSQCMRQTPIRYVDFEKLGRSYNMSYAQLIHFQVLFNRYVADFKEKMSTELIRPKEEELIFQEVLDLVKGGLTSFNQPEYEKVHILYIDDYLNDFAPAQKFIRSQKFLSGHPVIVSHCLSQKNLGALLSEHRIDHLGIILLGAESFSPYDVEGKRINFFGLNISELFKEEQQLILFSPREIHPQEFQGKFTWEKL